ncbi:MAG: PLDc N-terminal domain-containing protein [Acidimicrobiia bacterium]
MKERKKRLAELSRPKKVAIAVQIVIQLALLVTALLDLWRRPAAQIRGSKKLWFALAFVNYIGPIAYFVIGRKPAESVTEAAEELLAA